MSKATFNMTFIWPKKLAYAVTRGVGLASWPGHPTTPTEVFVVFCSILR
jgi:hypothetical protein